MKLLVTNDDGIDTLFLRALVQALQAAGHETFVVAPVTEQSWTGASKTRHRPVKSGAVDRGFGCPTWMVDGTPSDCVNIALAHLLPAALGAPKVEGVVSGINVGFNCKVKEFGKMSKATDRLMADIGIILGRPTPQRPPF